MEELSDLSKEDLVSILEMARIGCACVPDEIVDEMDISDKEYLRLREKIYGMLNIA